MEPSLEAPRAPDRSNAAREARVLLGRLRAVRRRIARLTWAEGLLWTAAAAAIGVAAEMVLDSWLELPRAVRMVWGSLTLVLALGILLWRVVRPLFHLPSDEHAALLVERRRGDLRSRLISALQLGGQPAGSEVADAFVNHLVSDAATATSRLDVRAAVPAESLRRCARVTLPVLAGILIGLGVAWPRSGVLLRRALGEEIALPRQTRLVEVTGGKTLGRGDDFQVSAVVEGVIPPTGRLVIRNSSGRVQSLPLDPDPTRPGRFSRTLANLPSSLFYRVRIHDAESEEFLVEVLPRPVTTNLVVTQQLPSYTRLAPRPLQPGDLSVLRGSRLMLVGEASQALRSANVRLLGLDTLLNAEVEPARSSRYAVTIPVDDPRLTAFSVDLVDARGIPSQDAAVYAVDVVRDTVPQIRMILPSRREELVTSRGLALLAWEVKDDFGLGSMQIRHQPVGATNDTPARIELDLTGETNSVIRRRFEWRFDGLVPPVREGSLIEFWVEATDRNTVDGPGIGRSERYLLRVVSEAEKRADLLGRAGDAIGRLSDVALGQERLNE